MNIMLDLETLSSRPDACIVAIGAAAFSNDGSEDWLKRLPLDWGGARPQFYVAVDPRSAQKAGGRIDAETVQWWAQQSDRARDVLNDPNALPIEQALAGFFNFCERFFEPKVWGNGASFDNAVLRQAYERLGMEAPWTFRNERCYRTLKNLRPDVAFEPFGTAHHALDDAIAQARHAERILAALRGAQP